MATTEEHISASPDEGLAQPSILIVDDLPANLLALEASLEPLGAKLVRATSGKAALRRLLEEDFDCILLDVQMPGLDGFETLKLIRGRERTRHVPIIFMSASMREKDEILRGYSEGAVDYILKPFNPELLRARVAALIEQGEYERRRSHALYERVKETEENLLEARAQSLLRAKIERARLYAVFQSAPFPVAVLRGAELELELMNPAAEELFGESSQVGRAYASIDSAFSRSGRMHLLREAFDHGEVKQQTEVRFRLGERDAYFNLVIQPTRSIDGDVDGLTLCAFDVTEQVRGRAQAEEAVRLRDEFLTVAAHELKTPITPLLLRLDALARRDHIDAPALKRQVSITRTHVERLARLVDSLLDVTRLAENRLFIDAEQNVDVSALVRELVEQHQTAAALAGCPITVDVEDGVKLTTDPQRLAQVLTNLLSNSLKYGAKKPVTISVRRHEDVVKLVVQDQGIGIAPEALERIFGKFERAVSERHYGGLGLGLYISRQIVEALGGKIRVDSHPAKGATFSVELPGR